MKRLICTSYWSIQPHILLTTRQRHLNFLLTLRSVSAVTQSTLWSLVQFIDVKPTAVTNFDVHRPATACFAPMKTHLGVHSTLVYCWMLCRKPAWCMRAAVKYSDARSRHFIACVSSEPVPALLQGVIAFSWLYISFEVQRSIGGVKIGIADTLYKSKKWKFYKEFSETGWLGQVFVRCSRQSRWHRSTDGWIAFFDCKYMVRQVCKSI